MASATSIYQSEDGAIWLGMDGSGLIHYDGYTFNEIIVENGDNDHHVTSIMASGDTIFFTSRYKGLYTYHNNHFKSIVTGGTKSGEFLKVVQFGNKRLLFTTSGIFLIEGQKARKLAPFDYQKHVVYINGVISLKKGCIVLTSVGNFHISSMTNRVIPLNNWLHISRSASEFVEYGYSNGESVFFYDRSLTKQLKVVLNEKEEIYDLNSVSIKSPFLENQKIVAMYGNERSNAGVFITSNNEIYRSTLKGFTKIRHNYEKPLENCFDVIIDKNGDYWIISTIRGLYKVSLEPFTKILVDPVYQIPSINTIHRSSASDILVSSMEGQTFIGNTGKVNPFEFRTYPFVTRAVIEYGGKLYLGTSDGLKTFDLNTKKILPFSELKDKITFIFESKNTLWIGIAGKGLASIDLKKGNQAVNYISSPVISNFIYTAQISEDGKQIYFGSNNGIFTYNTINETFTKFKTPKKIGSYVGVSIKDVFGNLWFTGDNAIIGIFKNGKTVLIDDRKILPSTLFYTLNSDSYGNLIIGTNKGITLIKVDKKGKILKHQTYDARSGFEGYETNMRAQFQNETGIFVGTIEGLFLINPDLLNDIPGLGKPVIKKNSNVLMSSKENAIQFTFNVNNPKIKKIQYSYRIEGYKDEWSELSDENQLFLSDLPNGGFVLEVRASNDGVNFSEIGRYDFTIDLPFWKSKWFVFILLTGIIILNIYLINRNRSFSTGNLFDTKDTSITVKLTPQILFFGFISNTAIHLVGPYIDPTIKSNLALTLTAGLIVLALYLTALTAKSNERFHLYKYLLISGFFIILTHNLIGVYYSNIQPFFIIAVVVLNTLSSYILERIKPVVIFSMIFILINAIMVIQLENTIYNKTLYLLAIVISTFVGVIITYMRYDSLEKLLFISGVINRGNISAIAFNSQGVMTYVSENISALTETSHEALIGKPISFLNTYVPDDGYSRRIDLTSDFEDGKQYIIPMISSKNDINFIEWSCKIFTEDVKVIIGQNVTERLELENTYELLVQNAEDLIYQCDLDGYIRFMNDRCFEKTGYSEQEIIGQHSLFFIPDDYKDRVNEFYKKHFEQRLVSSYYEFPIQTKHGEIFWVGQYVTTLYKPGDKKMISGFLALARDITISREQQEIIKDQRDDITSSINYAQKIQLNLLPGKEKFLQSFDEACIMYKAKDIVSGDFFWLERIDDRTVLALADCTGHGVPGSFMTLLGINLLNNLVFEQRIFHPGTILDELDKKLKLALPRESGKENMNDGMEIAICIFNHKTNELHYACAGSRFLVFENNSFTMFKGDSKHIGDKPMPEFKGYITHYTKFAANSTIYLFTDGFQDQFGGIKNKKYSFRRMLELFEANIRIPLDEQQLIIEEEFEKWKTDTSQTDDVAIIALRNLLQNPES